MNWKIVIFAASVGLSGCFSQDPKDINSDSAPSAVPAIKDAAQDNDAKCIPRLITDLDDPDPAIRFAAITALARITGQTMDYHYYDDDIQRQPAIQRWRQWLSEHPTPPPSLKD
ncbi:MAG: HEAT repeat domain-containing protein [Tepidisphaeraceae bacterium]|jgi:hypothetical protein